MNIPNPETKTVTLPLNEYLGLLENNMSPNTILEISLEAMQAMMTHPMFYPIFMGTESDAYSKKKEIIDEAFRKVGYKIELHVRQGVILTKI